MELTTLNKEYKLLRDESAEKFLKMTNIDPNINIVEEYQITSDHTLGNATAYFDSYELALEYALDRVDYRMILNEDGQKPFILLVNGKRNILKEDWIIQNYMKLVIHQVRQIEQENYFGCIKLIIFAQTLEMVEKHYLIE